MSEVRGRRAHVVFPVDGWGSVKTETGYVIMRKEDGDIYKYKIVLKEGAVIRNGADIDHSDVNIVCVCCLNELYLIISPSLLFF